MHTLSPEKVLEIKARDVEAASRVLREGGIILYPTDTIWGIGCDATCDAAIERIYAIKRRRPDKPFLLLADSVEMVRSYVGYVHPRVETLLAYHRRPLTIIYEGARNLPENLVAPDGTIGFRIPQDDFCRELIGRLGRPLVSTSANVSGAPFPAHFGEVSSEIIEQMDYVVRYRQWDTAPAQPSVVARVAEHGELVFLRH